MADIEKMISYAKSQWHRVRYSMGPERIGPHYMDCSSFVFKCLIAGGFLEKNTRIGNTEDLYRLNGKIFQEIYSYDQVQRGDIFIRGYQGASYGASGHTGIFLRKDEIIHCNATNDTVSINNEYSFIDYYLDRKRSGYERYFRPIVAGNSYKKIKNEYGRAEFIKESPVKASPFTKEKTLAVYKPGQKVNYDSIYQADGHLRLSYIAYSGKRRFVPYKKIGGTNFVKF